MKYSLFILLLVTPFIICQQPGYTILSQPEANIDPIVFEMLNFGFQTIVPAEIQTGVLNDTVYEITNVYTVEYYSDAMTQNYRFETTIADPQYQINVTYEVVNDTTTGAKSVPAYFFGSPEVRSTATPDSGLQFTPLDWSQASSDPAIVELFYFGVQYVQQIGKQQGLLNSSFYQVQDVYSVGVASGEAGESYKFEVGLVDPRQNVTNVTFVVLKSTTGEKSVTSYTIGSQPTPESSVPGPTFTQLDVTEALADPTINEILQFGYQSVIAIGIQEGSLVDTQYQIHNVTRIGNYETGQSYKFEVEINDPQQNMINVTYVVLTDTATGSRSVTSYSFGPWVQMDLAEVSKNYDITSTGAYGLQFVITIANDDVLLPESDYSPTDVISVEQQQVSNGWNYRWVVWIADSIGNRAEFIYVVNFDPTWGTMGMVTYEFPQISVVSW